MSPRLLLVFGLMALATAAAALLGGCVPVEHLDASPVNGQVVECATGQAIADAQVVLAARPDQEARTQTAHDGHFIWRAGCGSVAPGRTPLRAWAWAATRGRNSSRIATPRRACAENGWVGQR